MKALNNYLEENPKMARMIIGKVVLAAQARTAARKARELVQRKGASQHRTARKTGRCAEKTLKNVSSSWWRAILQNGTAKQGRDRHTQAILPLRGKILNVEKALDYKVFDNEEIKNILYSVMPNEDKSIDTKKLRYHKIVIMTDADVDGSHITTLILTFFFRKMYELVELGYIYIATPPLYMVKKERTLNTAGMKNSGRSRDRTGKRWQRRIS